MRRMGHLVTILYLQNCGNYLWNLNFYVFETLFDMMNI
jgi:hypothetical protein